MTVPASIIAVSSFKVGAAGTEYACTRFARTVKVLGPAQSSDATMRHEVWTATLHAVAANVAGIAAAWEAIRVALVKRGQRVTIAWHAGLRVLPESGTPAGVV